MIINNNSNRSYVDYRNVLKCYSSASTYLSVALFEVLYEFHKVCWIRDYFEVELFI